MGILSFLKGLFSFFNGVLGEIRERRLFRAGSDAISVKQLKGILDAVKEKNALDRELRDAAARDELREKHYRD